MNGMFTEMHERFPAVKDDFSQGHSTAIDILGIDNYVNLIDTQGGRRIEVRIPKKLPPEYNYRYISKYIDESAEKLSDILKINRTQVFKLMKLISRKKEDNDRLQTKPE